MPGQAAEESPLTGQKLETRLSSLGFVRGGPNQGLHHDGLRDSRLSVSGNELPNVSPGAVPKTWNHELLGQPERAGPRLQRSPAENPEH